MFGFLEEIVEVLVNLPTYLLFAIEEFINSLFSILQAAIEGALAILPTLPEVPKPPEFVEAVNWFFPVGAVIGIATALLVSYVTFLAISWILRKAGLIGGG